MGVTAVCSGRGSLCETSCFTFHHESVIIKLWPNHASPHFHKKPAFRHRIRDKLTDSCCSSGGGHQQHQNVLNDVRLELVQVGRLVAMRRQINL